MLNIKEGNETPPLSNIMAIKLTYIKQLRLCLEKNI